jgi:hypothetical protein
MTSSWPALAAAAAAAARPGLTVATGLAVAAAAWGLHIWRLRRRERDLLRMVDDRTRQWQEEAARLGRPSQRETTPHVARHLPGTLASSRQPRVLVVNDRYDEREALASVLDGLGVTPVFADSPWAATVATNEAESEGAPYDLILIGSSMEGLQADGIV